MTEKWVKWNLFKNDEKPKNVISKRLKVSLILFSLIFLLLVNLKIIEVLSLADGKIIPQGRIKYVQHLEGGIVEEILISEGEKVEINQPLVILSKEKASSEFEEINSRLKSIDLSILRVNSEINSNNSIEIPENKNNLFDEELVKSENELFQSRRKAINSEIKSKKASIDKANKNLKNLKKRLKIVKEQEDISQKLLEVEATNRLKHLEILRERQEVEGSIDEQQSIIDLSKNDLEKVQNNYIEELNIELSQYRKEKEELNKRIQKYSDSLNRTVLKSPVSGTVKLVSVNSKGAIVAPGVTVVEIVPENEKLIIEAKLPLSEIGYVKKNLEAKIRLNTPEGSRFRSIKGKVVFVGADRISSKDEEGFYLVKVETSENSFARKNEEYKLLSGVPVMVGIITGKRSFMDYFLTPFITGASFALSER
ncbi:MAG: HlyD family type I secretion periplasmic adaptor subunit [Alphaproteobacteria bacterium]|nr:MAG: HlyD family type I secretion periplasmic adaptor subunit [Alphaproteobacteria bacterium]